MKKFIVGLVFLAVLFLGVPQVKAMTLEDLAKEVESLKGEVASLKSQLAGQVLGATTSADLILYKGSKSPDVATIQSALKLKSDGVFGSQTEAAVRAFQASAGLPVTGVVDATTKSAIIYSSLVSAPSQTCDSRSEPFLRIISPNGGEIYHAGEQITVKWTSCNIVGNIAEVNLLDTNGWGGGTGVSFDKDIPNTGTYNLTLPSATSFSENHAQFGKYFKIELVAGNSTTGVIRDSSDNLFTINNTINSSGFPDGCTSNSNFSATTGLACSSGSHLVSYWWGKVNQHTNPGLNNLNVDKWETDPDGVSGANLDMLTYCKKWFPNTKSVVPFMNQTLIDWHERGNINNWTNTKMAYSCLP